MKTLEDIIDESTLRRINDTARSISIIRKNFAWLKNNGIQFVDPIHKTVEEVELEANKRYGVEDCSGEKNTFISAALWASNNI